MIKGGTIITPTDSYKADVGVDDGKIIAIGSQLSHEADDVIDAKGKLILPGGIDSHTHMEMPFMGTTTTDDFEYGTHAAAFGGVTTLIDFAMQPKDKTFLDTIALWRAKADPKVVTDYSLHVAVTNLNDSLIKEIPEVQKAGVQSFKLFMTYRKGGLMSEDGRIYQMLEESRKLGFLVQLHAENNSLLEMLIDRYVAAGNLSAEFHAKSRPNLVEGEAIHRGLALAKASGGNLYIVHTSTKEGLNEIYRAKASGANVFGETCPHYLTLTDEKYLSPKGRRYIMSPPLRGKADNEALWQGLADGGFDTVATDHCTFAEAQKDAGKDDFTKVPNGVPGIETMIPLLYSEGVRKRKITVNKLVELTSLNPAKLFGLYPRKGTLNVGSDADIVIFDPDFELPLTRENLHSRLDYSIYEEFTAKGVPTYTFVRGKPVVYNREFVGKKGVGKFAAATKPVFR